MPPLTDSKCHWVLSGQNFDSDRARAVLASHASDPAPISTTIRKCASEFKKTHQVSGHRFYSVRVLYLTDYLLQDTWHKDQQMFDEDQLQSLSSMLVGTSYCRLSCYLVTHEMLT